jgi:predicted anti-sigma-YlaC factor YlaD
MTDIDCESVRVAAMAIADSEESSLGPKEIESHLLNCEACREGVEDLRATNQVLSSQARLRQQVSVWPMVRERIQTPTESTEPFRWRVLLLFGIPLFGYKFVTLILDASPSLWSKLVPVLLMIAVFSYLRVNPFKINSELTLKGEWS